MQVNLPVLDRILALRRRIAELLGYDTWADYKTEVQMAKTPKAVVDFLTDFERKLHPITLTERDTLLAMKRDEHERLGLPFDGTFYAWDSSYYERLHSNATLQIDAQAIKQYFQVPLVVDAALEIYQTCLGVQFVEVKGDLWHPGM